MSARTMWILTVGLSSWAAAGFGQQGGEALGSVLGDPMAGISPAEYEAFVLGLEDFLEVEAADEGLGPVFNGRSCAECHSIPAVGGSGMIVELRAGIRRNGRFEEPPGGSLFPLFSIPPHQVQARIPPEANVVSPRKSLPLFGSGLVEAVPDATLLALADPEDENGDGISGRAPLVRDLASGEERVGRFGWKGQQATLIVFGAEAYRDEMGITNELFPLELCPYGVDCELLDFVDLVADPEDVRERGTGLRGIDNFESFLRFLAPPPRGEITPEVERGERIFRDIGCAACHTPALVTGPAVSPVLSHQRFYPWGDFLLHDIGTGDGIAQGAAAPEEIRTAPLWGLRFRGPLLHDGSAGNLVEAIEAHGGEAAASRDAFRRLRGEVRLLLLRFLRSL